MPAPEIDRRPAADVPRSFRRLGQPGYGWLVLGLAAMLILGVVILRDFGTSADEGANGYWGERFLKAYETGGLTRQDAEYFHGPFYFMVFTVTSKLFRTLNPGWLPTDGTHLTNLLTFLVGLFFFYRMSLRMLPRGVAFFVTALFAGQPVLFGHAFINQKDIPLMVFFLGSVELGWTAVDRLVAERTRSEPMGGRPDGAQHRSPAEEWRSSSRILRWLILLSAMIVILALMDLWCFEVGHRMVRGLLADAYQGHGPAFLVTLFGRVAQDLSKTPLEAYLSKLDRFLFWVRLPFTAVLLAGGLAVWSRAFPTSYARSMGTWLRVWGPLLVAGGVLGLTNSIRILAPFAGLLVAVYALGRLGRRAFLPLVLYGATAAVVTYLTWPALWGDPLGVMVNRVLRVSEFDPHEVLFLGTLRTADALPWFYLPLLLAVQLTIPCLALLLIGIPSSWKLPSTGRRNSLLVRLTWLWLLIPFLGVVLRLVPIYNNFRHFLFILPALFVVVGFGAWRVKILIHSPGVRAGLVVVALLPGLIGIVRMHPYEYTYYNELVGGVRGADGRFESDYWCTAFRAAMEYVNSVAKPNARVGIYRGTASASPYARPDLHLYRLADKLSSEPDYAVIGCRQTQLLASLFPEMETVHEVRVEGEVLAIVKQRAVGP